jgi:hypothetical protein
MTKPKAELMDPLIEGYLENAICQRLISLL